MDGNPSSTSMAPEVPDAVPAAAAEEVKSEGVCELILPFKNICNLDYLMGFGNLVTLQLDHNAIDRIQNLEHLVNLRRLDLSFNHIAVIENLDNLRHLTNLSLFNNRIAVIQNLEKLTKLKILSLGNNKITDPNGVKDLYRFPNLRMLHLTGNPVCEDDEYQEIVDTHFLTCICSDEQLIEAFQLPTAREIRLEMEERRRHGPSEIVEHGKGKTRVLPLDRADIEGLSSFFDRMVLEDVEYQKLQILPGYQTIVGKKRVGTRSPIMSGPTFDTLLAKARHHRPTTIKLLFLLDEYRARFATEMEDLLEQILKVLVEKDEEKRNCKQGVKRVFDESRRKGVVIWQVFDTAKAKALEGRAYELALALHLCWTTAFIIQPFPISCQAGSACTHAYSLASVFPKPVGNMHSVCPCVICSHAHILACS